MLRSKWGASSYYDQLEGAKFIPDELLNKHPILASKTIHDLKNIGNKDNFYKSLGNFIDLPEPTECIFALNDDYRPQYDPYDFDFNETYDIRNHLNNIGTPYKFDMRKTLDSWSIWSTDFCAEMDYIKTMENMVLTLPPKNNVIMIVKWIFNRSERLPSESNLAKQWLTAFFGVNRPPFRNKSAGLSE